MRFTIRSLLILAVIAAFWFANNPLRVYGPREITSHSISAPDGRWIAQITTGIRHHKQDRERDKLDFCVIHRVDGNWPVLHGLVHHVARSDEYHQHAYILIDGRKIHIGGGRQLHEVINGRYRASDRRLTLSQFQNAIEKMTGPPSLAALLHASDEVENSNTADLHGG